MFVLFRDFVTGHKVLSILFQIIISGWEIGPLSTPVVARATNKVIPLSFGSCFESSSEWDRKVYFLLLVHVVLNFCRVCPSSLITSGPCLPFVCKIHQVTYVWSSWQRCSCSRHYCTHLRNSDLNLSIGLFNTMSYSHFMK